MASEDPEPTMMDRRRLLGRMGAGAAIVWTAPMIDTFASSAAAQSAPSPCTSSCASPDICGVECGSGCLCGVLATGGCACFTPVCDGPPCGTNADCPPGWACVAAGTCCGSDTAFCAPLCGTPDPPALPGATPLGRGNRWVAA
jgi:hypothetical protein